ncbi:hypothetical protein NTE_01881 [Candidatus Nitrososphaera evergladensis SR1]|uniref:Uncharacterized protein n=1 Tax=Candidatus Nitrososphaera evergladensis SR1 TaxID=1459636 RepID=A0A075MS50_9ARCH|nr:hypothetical protein [Candidatus Nitrososphaera evergladensis]AIF83940.1 hypothetical protein NTE_01881 [Candidatus Nitrososphaera evergladensis SR1]
MNEELDKRKIKGVNVDEAEFHAKAEELWGKYELAIIPLRSPLDKSMSKSKRGLLPVDRDWQTRDYDPDPFVKGSRYAKGFYPNLAIATGSPGNHVLLSMDRRELPKLPLSEDLLTKLKKSSEILARGGGRLLKYKREEFPNGIPTIELGKTATLYGNGHYVPVLPSFTVEWDKYEAAYGRNKCGMMMPNFGVVEVSKAELLKVLQCFGETLPEEKESKKISHSYMEDHKENINKFIAACCTVGFGRRVQTTTFVDELNKWCAKNNLAPIDEDRVGNVLNPMGFKRRQARVNGGRARFYEGLSISLDVTSVTTGMA